MDSKTVPSQKTEVLLEFAKAKGLVDASDKPTRAELIELCKMYLERQEKMGGTPPEPTPPEQPQESKGADESTLPEEEKVVINKKEFDQLLQLFEKQDLRLKQLESLSDKVEAKHEAGEDTTVARDDMRMLFKDLVREIRGEVNKDGYVRPEFELGPENILEKEARFWVRAPNFNMTSLEIGAVPQALPFGLKRIKFTKMIGPVTMRDPNYPIPQVVIILQYRTRNKRLAELIRQDARYGSRIFEDVSALREAPIGNEYHLAKERHLNQLRQVEDPSYVFAQAVIEGIPHAVGDNPEKLRQQVAHKRALAEIGQNLSSLHHRQDENRRVASLADPKALPAGYAPPA